MILAVDELNFEVDHRIARDGATRRRVLDSLLYRRPPLLRDRAAEYFVLKLEPAAAWQSLEHASRFAKLTATARLFLVPADDFGTALECFKIGNLRRIQLDLDAVSPLQFVHRDFDVGLSRAGKKKLFR